MLPLAATEIIERIAYHTALTYLDGIFHPPSGLIDLLLVNRSMYQLLNSVSNPHLYAHIFRATFDFRALRRRFPYITASVLANELKRRWTVLKRVRARVHGEPFAWQSRRYRRVELLEDMMTMYLMFTESDFNNARLLFRYAQIQGHVAQYRTYRLEPAHRNPQMPDEKEETTLFLWLSWFCLDYGESRHPAAARIPQLVFPATSLSEPAGSRANFEWLLMPYARGTFKYANVFASSDRAYLPKTLDVSDSPASLLHPDYRGIRPQSDAFTLGTGYMGCVISPPLAHHAAILLWTARVQDRLQESAGGGAGLAQGITNDDNLEQTGPTVETSTSVLHLGRGLSISTMSGIDVLDVHNGLISYTPDHMRTSYATVSDSTLWDGEWRRMVGCRNAFETNLPPWIKYRWPEGSLSGLWDGIFLLPALDDWVRVRNTLIFPQNPNDTENHPPNMAQPSEDTLNVLEESVVNNMRPQQSWLVQEYRFNSALSLPGAEPISSANSDPSHGHLPKTFSIVKLRESKWDGGSGRWTNGITVKESSDLTPAFYEVIQPGSSDKVPDLPNTIQTIVLGSLASPPTSLPERTQMFLPGSLFYGTVRLWDGLVTLRFDSPNHRMRDGEWIYQGYILNSSNWVGRWTEAHTPDGFEGAPYGGVFCMSRRRVT